MNPSWALLVVFSLPLLGCNAEPKRIAAAGKEPPEPFYDPSTINCPGDPDCAISDGDHCVSCPNYWVCEPPRLGSRDCWNPGPAYPNQGDVWWCHDLPAEEAVECSTYGGEAQSPVDSANWNCVQQEGRTVCRGETRSLPAEACPSGWRCQFTSRGRRVCTCGRRNSFTPPSGVYLPPPDSGRPPADSSPPPVDSSRDEGAESSGDASSDAGRDIRVDPFGEI